MPTMLRSEEVTVAGRARALAVLALFLAAAYVPAVSAAQGQAAPAGSGAAAPPASPMPPPNAAPEAAVAPLEESIEVTVVSLDVVVRDRSGNLVPGLKRSDFKLFVDGKPVDITNFSASGPGQAPTPAPATAAAAPASPPAAAAEEGAPAPQHLSLVVFVDNANMRPFDRNRLLKQLRAFLQKTLRPDDQVLLVTHDPGLRVRHLFHDSAASLYSTLEQLEKESAVGLNRDIAARQELDELRDQVKTNGCGAVAGAVSQAKSDAESALADARETYGTLHHLLKSLGGVGGRKALIYVGDGMATHVGTASLGMLQDLCPNAHVTFEALDATPPMRQVIADANANLITFYALEARGLDAYVSTEHAGKPLLSFEVSRLAAVDRQDSLLSLARETGGRAAINGNDFGRDLEAMATEMNASYSLGFTPGHAGEGKAHDIRVEVDVPGSRVTYRNSYRDRTLQERLESQVEAVLIHAQTDNPLAASVKIGDAAPAEHGRVLLAVQVRVPFGKLALAPAADGRHGRVDIVFGAADARGAMAPLQRMQLPLRVPEADAKRVLASQLGYDAKLLLTPGRQRLAFLVRDDVARISSSVVQEVDVDKAGKVTLAAAAAGGPAAP